MALLGCGQGSEAPAPSGNDGASDAALPAIKVGTLQTDDLLPLWAASEEGRLSDAGLDVEIIVFQSGQEQIAAMTAGEIDALMTDMVVSALLSESNAPVRAVTVMGGAPAGIVVGPEANISDLKDLANVPVGVATPTAIEYVVDAALADAGVPDDEVKFEVVPKLPVRLEMLMAGNIDAAALPWTLAALAEKQGASIILDRDQARAYGATVLCFSQSFLDGKPASGDTSTPELAATAVQTVLTEWDRSVEAINADPDGYRELLVETANLPEPLRESFPIPTYPNTQLPDEGQWTAVLDWMKDKGYLTIDLSYDQMVFTP